jgi:hypothetical protein
VSEVVDAEVDIGGGIKAVGMQAIVGAMRVISAVLELVCVYKYITADTDIRVCPYASHSAH